jgi:hypothetical protein
VSKLQDDESIVPGDLLNKSPECGAQYPKWNVNSGVVLSIKKRTVSDDSLGSSDRATYRSRYGYQQKYPIYEIIISTSTCDFMASQFHFNKDH